ncbi:hypothetical protein HPB48_010669 [Haemaphysalis longicornis]|uniref:Uncharacterized protein n=1 Tax=Haemaphysalis longicornis TaxID=44386 RepID=A0A9J6G2D1_HAELO|nr:hypothetical protein HPB48_010669 [Haemaphysalis longicornis]
MNTTVPTDSANQNATSHDMDTGTNPHFWQFLSTAPRQAPSTTMVLKFLDNTNLCTLNFAHLCHALLQTAGLTKLKRNNTFIKLPASQNLLAIDTYRPTAVQKITSLQEVLINGKCHGVRSCLADNPSNARWVIIVSSLRSRTKPCVLSSTFQATRHQLSGD